MTNEQDIGVDTFTFLLYIIVALSLLVARNTNSFAQTESSKDKQF